MENELRINKRFAAHYTKKKEREELSRLEEKFGANADSLSSSSSEEEEDENAEELTSDVERDFLRTLSLLKSKDPSIYNSQTQFYRQPQAHQAVEKSMSQKSVYLKDYERQRLLEKGRSVSPPGTQYL